MLLEFSVGNYLSFKDTKTFSMISAQIKEHEDENVFFINKLKLLKSAVLYGANASGKSNLLKAMNFMRRFVFNSSKETQATETIKVNNFKLSTKTEKKPSFFEIIFIHEGNKYRYGFEVDKNRVYSEWLFFVPSRQESKLFIRNNDDIEIGTTYFKEGKGLENKTRPNALFLSVVAQFNGEIAKKILEWFKKFKIISGISDKHYFGFTLDQLENTEFKNKFLKYLKIADLDIIDVDIERIKVDLLDLPENLKQLTKEKDIAIIERILMTTLHQKYNNKKQPISIEKFDFEEDESEGTKKYFGLLGPIIDTLENGSILVVDELDTRLHPFITRFIVELFNSKFSNKKNAQLIFATHDTNLLTNKLFRRDQIWFTEKNKYGITDLYSLVEYKEADKKIRKDAYFEKDYMLGKYGAIPFIDNYNILLKDEYEQKKNSMAKVKSFWKKDNK